MCTWKNERISLGEKMHWRKLECSGTICLLWQKRTWRRRWNLTWVTVTCYVKDKILFSLILIFVGKKPVLLPFSWHLTSKIWNDRKMSNTRWFQNRIERLSGRGSSGASHAGRWVLALPSSTTRSTTFLGVKLCCVRAMLRHNSWVIRWERAQWFVMGPATHFMALAVQPFLKILL